MIEHGLSPILPDSRVISVQKGKIEAHPITTANGAGIQSIAAEGSGMIGLKDAIDNSTWSGMFNHVLISKRLAVHLSQKMRELGHNIDPKKVSDGFDVSHAGRRVGEESRKFPELVEDAKEKASITYESMGARIIKGKVPNSAFELVVALGHGIEEFKVDRSIYESLDYKIAIYADHRSSQKIEPLNERMGDFLLNSFFTKDQITLDKKQEVYNRLYELIETQKRFILAESEAEAVTLDEADRIAEELGASEGSERLTRKELMRLILQDAETEGLLVKSGIDVKSLNTHTVPPTRWEKYFRRLYINDAEKQIFSKITDSPENFDQDFPANSWWGNYVRELYVAQEGKPYESKTGKLSGVDRAIDFFLEWLEKTNLKGNAQNLPKKPQV